MPVKKLRVSFDIDMDVLVKALAIGHSDMNIQAYGTEEPSVSHTQPVVAQITDRGGMRNVILKALSGPGKLRLHELRVIIVAAGYSAKSLNGQIHLMQVDGYVRRAGYGTFAITKKGRNHEAA